MNKILEIIAKKIPWIGDNYFKIIFLFLAIFSATALILAYISQYFFDFVPCILCLYQRLPFFIILFLSAIGVVFNFKKLINKLFFYVIILSLIANIFIAFYHSGVEKKIFKEFSGCNVKTNSVMVNIAQLREILQDSKIAKCDDPQLFIFGLTMAQWNFIYCLFLLIIVIYCYFRLIIKNNNNFN